jgi:hypothetical protein
VDNQKQFDEVVDQEVFTIISVIKFSRSPDIKKCSALARREGMTGISLINNQLLSIESKTSKP